MENINFYLICHFNKNLSKVEPSLNVLLTDLANMVKPG